MSKGAIISHDKFIQVCKDALASKDYTATWILHVSSAWNDKLKDQTLPSGKFDNENLLWAVVLGWCDYDNTGTPELNIKFAHKTNYTILDDYDCDWDFPTIDDSTGELDINEHTIDKNTDLEDMYTIFENIAKSYVTKED